MVALVIGCRGGGDRQARGMPSNRVTRFQSHHEEFVVPVNHRISEDVRFLWSEGGDISKVVHSAVNKRSRFRIPLVLCNCDCFSEQMNLSGSTLLTIGSTMHLGLFMIRGYNILSVVFGMGNDTLSMMFTKRQFYFD